MRPDIGSALEGRYTVEREIGRGGMATVYLARDLRHNRNVALKFLDPELGAVLGVERFLAEIRVTATLQHPNILPLFDSGEVNGQLFYVMPYVDGESLRRRLDREKQLSVDDAVRISTAIAGALDYAHRHQIIHRDLKPENILLHEGQPLIADFGIALAVSNAGGARITQTGLSLGTPQYMSPEQATGDRAIDGRTDVYSLGALTYEMLVGDPPHVASTAQAVIAKVLTEKPVGVRTGRPSVPPHVEAAVSHALEKLPADRFTTARDFADALNGKTTAPSNRLDAAPAAPAATRRPSWMREGAAWSLAVALAALLVWRQLTRDAQTEAPVVRSNVDMPAGTRVNTQSPGTTIAISPNGDMIAFAATKASPFNLYVRRVNELAPRQILSEAGGNFAFSPNGRWLAFSQGNLVKKISVDGGQPVTLVNSGVVSPLGLAWSPTDTIYIGTFGGLWSIPASGGTPRLVRPIDSQRGFFVQRWPVMLPGGKAVAYAASNSLTIPARLAILELENRRVTEFDLELLAPLGFLADQFIYVSLSGSLMAVGFDSKSKRIVGEPVRLDDGVLGNPTGGVKAALSASGTLVYLSGRQQLQLVLVRAGATSAPTVLGESGMYSSPRFSPDGRRIAMTVVSPTNTSDVWIYDRPRNTFTRLTTEGMNVRPEWTPDGRDVVFISTRSAETGIWRQPADGSRPAERIFQPEHEPFEAVMSPDMKWLVFRTGPGTISSRDILAVPLSGERKAISIVAGPDAETMPRLSPDGQWLAYQSSESGRFEIYVRRFPGPGARVQVSDSGGTEPMWSRTGRSLYYRNQEGAVVEVVVPPGTEFSIGQRRVVVSADYLTDASHPNYDVGPEGFLLLRGAGSETQAIIVHNWSREVVEKTRKR